MKFLGYKLIASQEEKLVIRKKIIADATEAMNTDLTETFFRIAIPRTTVRAKLR
jgi:hypothetical protein